MKASFGVCGSNAASNGNFIFIQNAFPSRQKGRKSKTAFDVEDGLSWQERFSGSWTESSNCASPNSSSSVATSAWESSQDSTAQQPANSLPYAHGISARTGRRRRQVLNIPFNIQPSKTSNLRRPTTIHSPSSHFLLCRSFCLLRCSVCLFRLFLTPSLSSSLLPRILVRDSSAPGIRRVLHRLSSAPSALPRRHRKSMATPGSSDIT